MKEYITDGGRRFVRKNGLFYAANGEVCLSPREMDLYLKQTGTKLNEAKHCTARMVDNARYEDLLREEEAVKRKDNFKKTLFKYGIKV